MQRKTSLRLTEKDSLHWQRLTGTAQAPFITVIINDPQCRRSEKKNLSFKGIKKSKMTAKKSSINNKVGTALGQHKQGKTSVKRTDMLDKQMLDSFLQPDGTTD